MREYGQIQCAFWQSDDATKSSDAGKLLATYLMTGPHSNGIGCYRCPDGYVMEDLGWSSERVSEGFAELSRNRFAYRFDGVVFLPNFLRWNKVANGNVAMARIAEFQALPKGQAKVLAARALLTFARHLDDDAEAYLLTVAQTVTETVCQTEPNPNQPNPDPIQPPLSSAEPTTDQPSTTAPPADLAAKRQERAERVSQITDDAITAYNATLAKPKGLLAAVSVKVGKDKRRAQVGKCLRVVREICAENYGSTTVTPAFWNDYFAACAEDDFLRGAGPYSGTHANWRPDFEYLTREATVLKVYERAANENAA